MAEETLVGALEREHHEIDAGIEAFMAQQAAGQDGAEPLQQAFAALRRHIYLEEEFLFPPLRAAGLMMPIMVMLREHGELWQTMQRLDALLAEDPGADDVQKACRELLDQLARHNEKEEPIIYPQADLVLDEPAIAALREFVTTGRMPEGWVCQGAGR